MVVVKSSSKWRAAGTKNSYIAIFIGVTCVISLLTYRNHPLQAPMTTMLVTQPQQTDTLQPTLQQQRRSPRLEFVSYTSSEWEKLWLENIDKWMNREGGDDACHQLLNEQAHFVHDFLKLMCTTHFTAPFEDWCCLDDFSTVRIYYNTSNRAELQLSFTPPEGLELGNPPVRPEPIIPTKKDEHVVSKFVYRDTNTGEELVEYIEPLVSHLRFPLAGCGPFSNYDYVITKTYLLPPSPTIRSSRRRFTNSSRNNPYHDRYLYFDAGASSWSQGPGGPSLEYFTNMWQRYGIVFDDIFAFEASTEAHDFYKSVPNLFWSDRTFYQQGYVSSRPEDDTPATPFIPKFIQRHATIDDYVIFKLDIDSAGVEQFNIEYILDKDASNNTHLWIDELFWEHHIYDNPFMRGYWFPGGYENQTDPTLRGSYNKFLTMRQMGIRAHSWV